MSKTQDAEQNLYFEQLKALAEKNIALKSEPARAYLKYLALAYQNVGYTFYLRSDYSNSIVYYLKGEKIAEEIGDKQSAGRTLSNIGCMYEGLAKYDLALEYSFKGLKLNKEAGDKRGIGSTLTNIGNIYNRQADYPKTLEYYFKALKLLEELGDKPIIGNNLANIGSVYVAQTDYPKAAEYYNRALIIFEKLEDQRGVSALLTNLAGVYSEQANYTKALEYLYKALKIAEQLGDPYSAGGVLTGIASVYNSQHNYVKAMEYNLKSLKLSEESGDKQSVVSTLYQLGVLYTNLNKFKEAELSLKKALFISKEIGTENLEIQIHNYLFNVYEKTKRPDLALEHYKKYISLRDTIFSKENSKKLIRSEMNHDFEKKELEARALQEKKDLKAAEEKQKQKIITYSISIGLVLVLLLAVFIFRGLRQKQKANLIITQQKKEVETQKHLIEEKHKEITDSINYAERIQRSFIASKEHLDANLNDHFVLFKPKDVVSGDFYWSATLNNGNFILATADSTGHGVPRAIMSLLNITSLEKAVETLTEPSEILNSTRKTIIARLKKDGSEYGGKDGMDASLTVYDFKNKKLIIAAANNPVWIVRGTETIEIKAEKMPVGKHDRDNVSFTQQEIELQKGDVVYTLTDGFPDQFGGEKGKKFMSKNLRELLSAHAHLPMNEQKQLLEKTFSDWVGNLEQVDDVTLIGVRI